MTAAEVLAGGDPDELLDGRPGGRAAAGHAAVRAAAVPTRRSRIGDDDEERSGVGRAAGGQGRAGVTATSYRSPAW